jgi:hypothetical protein
MAGDAYNKINNWTARAIRKLSNYHIFVNGRKTECTRLTKINDVWGNADSETISVSQIQAVFVFPPGETPLIRLRAGKGTQAEAQSSGLFFLRHIARGNLCPLGRPCGDRRRIVFFCYR